MYNINFFDALFYGFTEITYKPNDKRNKQNNTNVCFGTYFL